METTFNFTSISDIYSYSINYKISLHIYNNSDSIANMYFTDENNNTIDIPNGFVVYRYDFQNPNKRVIQSSIQNKIYALCWSENYDIEYNGKNIVNINNKRSWIITNN